MSPSEESWQRRDDALVPLTQECRQNVFADSFPPQVIAAVAAGVGGGVEVDPMVLGSSRDAVTSCGYSLTTKPEASLQTVEIDAPSGVEVDEDFVRHGTAPNPGVVLHTNDCTEQVPAASGQ